MQYVVLYKVHSYLALPYCHYVLVFCRLQKVQTVVIEFPRDLPRDVLITLEFYYENTAKRLGTVPVVLLGPRTVKANFVGK